MIIGVCVNLVGHGSVHYSNKHTNNQSKMQLLFPYSACFVAKP